MCILLLQKPKDGRKLHEEHVITLRAYGYGMEYGRKQKYNTIVDIVVRYAHKYICVRRGVCRHSPLLV